MTLLNLVLTQKLVSTPMPSALILFLAALLYKLAISLQPTHVFQSVLSHFLCSLLVKNVVNKVIAEYIGQ
jgi:uncharacterized membrane protein